MKSLIIIGASGHGRVAADIACILGYKKIQFLDDSDNCSMPVLGKVCDFKKFVKTHDFFVGIGNNEIRKNITKTLVNGGANIVSLVHPDAVISKSAVIGRGVVVMAGAVINCGAIVGDGAIINTCSSVDHDCEVGDFTHISVGAHLAGTVNVGDGTFVGVGATVINNIQICGECMIGAGAVVVKNIEDKGTYVGVPARKL